MHFNTGVARLGRARCLDNVFLRVDHTGDELMPTSGQTTASVIVVDIHMSGSKPAPNLSSPRDAGR